MRLFRCVYRSSIKFLFLFKNLISTRSEAGKKFEYIGVCIIKFTVLEHRILVVVLLVSWFFFG
jgi:hypothetical protein